MEGQKFAFSKIPEFFCLNGRLWTQFGRIVFYNFPEFRKKMISRGDLGQHRPEEFSSRSWIRRGAISCSSHTSFDEIIDSAINSGRGDLVGGSDPPLVSLEDARTKRFDRDVSVSRISC